MLNRFFLIPLCALCLSFGTSGAQAQGASYCGGRVAAKSFDSKIHSTGSTSQGIYFVQLQNRTVGSIKYAVRFTAPHVIEAQNGQVVFTMEAMRSATIRLGTQNFNNPSGTGALSQADLQRYTQVTCSG